MRALKFTLALAACALPAAALAAGPTEQQAVKMQDGFLAALSGTDLKAISALLSEDVTFVHPNGMALTKKGEMDLMGAAPLPRYNKLDEVISKVRVYSDTVIMNGTITYTGFPKNGVAATPNSYLLASAWANEKGTWRLVSWQQTGIAKPPAPKPVAAATPAAPAAQ